MRALAAGLDRHPHLQADSREGYRGDPDKLSEPPSSVGVPATRRRPRSTTITRSIRNVKLRSHPASILTRPSLTLPLPHSLPHVGAYPTSSGYTPHLVNPLVSLIKRMTTLALI